VTEGSRRHGGETHLRGTTAADVKQAMPVTTPRYALLRILACWSDVAHDQGNRPVETPVWVARIEQEH